MTTELHHYLVLSAALFGIGIAGVFLRRNLITVLLSIEVMLNAANLPFVAVGRLAGAGEGEVIAVVIIIISAAEAMVGLAIITTLFGQTGSLNPDALRADIRVAWPGAAARTRQTGSLRGQAVWALLGAIVIVGYLLWK